MIKLDSKKLEDRIKELFIESISITDNKYYNTTNKKMNMFAEFYIYTHFFLDIMYKPDNDSIYFEKLDKTIVNNKTIINKLKQLLSKSTIQNYKDIDNVKDVLNEIYVLSGNYRNNLNNGVKKKYGNISNSIIRKLKISLVLKLN